MHNGTITEISGGISAADAAVACNVLAGLLASERPLPNGSHAGLWTVDRKEIVNSHSDLVVAVAKRRDRAAFRELFDHFAPRLRSFILRRGADMAVAEEVVQEAMVRVWRKADKFDPDKASASTWIFTIGRNAHIDIVRRVGRPEIDANDPTFQPEPEPDALTRIAQGQNAGRVRTALTGLPGEQREILMLAFFEDKPHGRIAEELDLPLGTVKSRIRLAFKRLRSELEEDLGEDQ